MDEKLQLALAQLIEKSMTGVDKSIDFLSAEIPDVVYQLLLWYGVESAIYTLLGIIGILIIIPINKKIHKFINKSFDYPEIFFGYLGLIGFDVVTVTVCTGWVNLTWLQIWIAPKVWLLDYASSFVK